MWSLAACGGGGGGNSTESGAVSGVATGSNAAVSGSAGEHESVAGSGEVQAPILPLEPASPGSDPAVANDVVADGTTTVDAAKYQATAAMMGDAGGVDYRFGPSASAYGASAKTSPTWYQRKDTAFVSDQNGGERKCSPGYCGTWQVGQLQAAAGGFSSNSGTVAYTPDDPAARVGVADVLITAVSNGVFTQKPELPWTLYGAGLDDINAMAYRKTGADTSRPVALTNCNGRPGWCMNSIMAFKNGAIGSSLTNTSSNQASVQLAPNKVPTAVAVSNSNEFAFITVWDTSAMRGEIAVVALAGLCDGCTPGKPGEWYDYWGEWKGVYPGLPNLGDTAYMKVLGYVPLPDGMKAPTGISVTTGVDRANYLPNAGSNSPWSQDLGSQDVRNSFGQAAGSRYKSYAKSGVAVVVSKSEQRVAFIDLAPLFQYYKRMYFGTSGDFANVGNLGSADNQWPFTFKQAPEQTPRVLAMQNLPSRPTAVAVYPWGSNKRAWIATQNGQLHLFGLGAFSADGGVASGFNEIAAVAVGRNPTGIAFAKEKAQFSTRIYPDYRNELIVTSRGDQRVDWVRLAADGNSGAIVRTLTDSRMVDPIASEDTDNHSTESYVLSVADYAGRGLHNYRYGPVIMHNYPGSACASGCGMGASGNDPFEYGGKLELPGRAFQVRSVNTP